MSSRHTLPKEHAHYDDGIAFTDAQLGRLFQRLEEIGIEDNTLVVLTSDHGEMLGEHGVFGHGQLYDEVVLVPLVLAHPGRLEGGRRIHNQVRSVDIAPTILDLVGLRLEQQIDGVSLKPLFDGDPLFYV